MRVPSTLAAPAASATRTPTRAVLAAAAVGAGIVGAAGCGLEALFVNLGRDEYARPASKIMGLAPADALASQLAVINGDGAAIDPFESSVKASGYELRLPSAKYSMLRVRYRFANMELRSVVPFVGEESEIREVNLDARNLAETLIAEGRLSLDGESFKQVTPEAYLGTRKILRADLDKDGPAKELLGMVERLITQFDRQSGATEPQFFRQPALEWFTDPQTNQKECRVKVMGKDTFSPLDNGWLSRSGFDYVGDGRSRFDSADFDATLCEAAQKYRPSGCPDPSRIRVLFTVDFNEGGKNGNCGQINRFLWAKDAQGKKMYFVGWIHKQSDIQDPDVHNLLGGGTPNNIVMYDDGTNGDQTAGDNVWSIYFDLPRSSPGKVLRIGYKYTWGKRGDGWTGSEEWPGNSRILEVVDDNGDDLVYRYDVFGDEATNKDNSNLNTGKQSTGSIDWKTDLHECGTPTSHENEYDNKTCKCTELATPKWIGPLRAPCSQ